MAFLTNLTDWLVRTEFYIDFCSKLPQPLNNLYFDVLVIIIALIMIFMRIRDGVMSYVLRIRIRKKSRGSADRNSRQSIKPTKKRKHNKENITQDVKEIATEEGSEGIYEKQLEEGAVYVAEKGAESDSFAIDVGETGDSQEDLMENNATDVSVNEGIEDSEEVNSTLTKGYEEPDPSDISHSIMTEEPDAGSVNGKTGIDVKALIESIPDAESNSKPERDRNVSEFDLLMMNLKNQQESKAKNEEIKEKTAQIRERNLAALDKKISSNMNSGEETVEDKNSFTEDLQADVEARREEYRKEEERKARKGLFGRKEKQNDNKK